MCRENTKNIEGINNTMKICFIVGAFPRMKCGIGDYCSKLAIELANQGNEVSVITSTKASNDFKNINVYNIVDNWDRSNTKRIISKLKEINPDIVNIQYPSDEYKNHYYIFNILPFIIKIRIRCKLTETIHEYDLTKLSKQRKIRYFFNFILMNKVIVVEEIFKTLIKNDFKKVNVNYIPISSSIPKIELSEKEKDDIKDKLGFKEKNVISYFGFVNEQKGVESLLKAISCIEDTQLLFLSELDSNNNYHKEILELIEELDIKNKIIITGFMESELEVARYLSASDVCILPFTNGLKKRNSSFLAAYNQNIPIITTSSENDQDKDGIYFVACNNTDELTKKIKVILEKNEKVNREELNWKRVAEQYINTFV